MPLSMPTVADLCRPLLTVALLLVQVEAGRVAAFAGHWKDAAVCADRFEFETLGRHLRLEHAGKALVCIGGKQCHNDMEWMRCVSRKEYVTSIEHVTCKRNM